MYVVDAAASCHDDDDDDVFHVDDDDYNNDFLSGFVRSSICVWECHLAPMCMVETPGGAATGHAWRFLSQKLDTCIGNWRDIIFIHLTGKQRL
jgi:hypothetical protein